MAILPSKSFNTHSVVEWLSYIESLHISAIDMSLERIQIVFERLNLNLQFPIVIVGGTNGKGSICAMLESIYRHAGYKVACYTSPHFIRFNERIMYDGKAIDDNALLESFAFVEQGRGDIPLTYFEFGTLAAITYFAQQTADIAILEIGLGGRLDAVNIFTPQLSIIASVDLDHTDILGKTREAIGFEKAGIFRSKVPAIYGELNLPQSVIDYAKTHDVPLKCFGQDFRFLSKTDNWTYQEADFLLPQLDFPNLLGEFQLQNSATVVCAIRSLNHLLPVPLSAINKGLKYVSLMGRFQTLSESPLFIVDVAHNPHAVRSLAMNLQKKTFNQGKTIAIFGMLADKDVAGVIREIAELIDEWYVVSLPKPRGLTADELAKILKDVQKTASVLTFASVSEAYHVGLHQKNVRIIGFGSFLLLTELFKAVGF